jgi:antitoxin VapB
LRNVLTVPVAGLLETIYISGIYHLRTLSVTTKTAKLFKSGRSQAVRLPKEFRFEGKEVRIRRHGAGVLLEPMRVDMQAVFDAMDAIGGDPIFPNGREQPPMQEREFNFD